MLEVVTKSAQHTKKIAAVLGRELRPQKSGATVLALHGNLGAGKTTFAQGLARVLGVKENVLSPTFVLLKIYPLRTRYFKHLIHIDCYRLDSPRELLHLGFKKLLKDKDALIVIEWADRIKKILPPSFLHISFRHKTYTVRKIIFTPKHTQL